MTKLVNVTFLNRHLQKSGGFLLTITKNVKKSYVNIIFLLRLFYKMWGMAKYRKSTSCVFAQIDEKNAEKQGKIMFAFLAISHYN